MPAHRHPGRRVHQPRSGGPHVEQVPERRHRVHRVGRRQPRGDLQPRTVGPHDLRDRRRSRREDSAQGRPRHHQERPLRHQQDRPRTLRRRRPRRDGSPPHPPPPPPPPPHPPPPPPPRPTPPPPPPRDPAPPPPLRRRVVPCERRDRARDHPRCDPRRHRRRHHRAPRPHQPRRPDRIRQQPHREL